MKKLYLIGAIIVFLLILVLSLPQIGTSCGWYLIKSTSNPTFVLFQAAGLGGIMGGLLVLFWKEKGESVDDDEDDGGISEGGA